MPTDILHLIDPSRSANRSIRGYLYQTVVGVKRWLALTDGEVLVCEGNEDLDRYHALTPEKASWTCEQVKATMSMDRQDFRKVLSIF